MVDAPEESLPKGGVDQDEDFGPEVGGSKYPSKAELNRGVSSSYSKSSTSFPSTDKVIE